MDLTTLQDLVARDGARMDEVVTALPLTAPVPTCPGWTVRDLVEHTAVVYEHKLVTINLAGPPPDPWPPAWPADRDPVAWLADARGRLLQRLRTTPPDAPSWTFVPHQQHVGFWSRRMAHETAVHRVDAEAAAGTVTSLDPELAVDGVAEVLHLVLAGDGGDADPPGPTTRVVLTTGDHAWTSTLAPDRVEVADGRDEAADLVVEAAPSDLDLWLWGRVPDAAVRITGDRSAATRFRARVAVAVG